MFQKGFLQAVRHNLQKAFFKHVRKKTVLLYTCLLFIEFTQAFLFLWALISSNSSKITSLRTLI